MNCGAVSIVVDDDSSGHSICADPWETATTWDHKERYREISLVFRGRILTYMAGAEAERVILGEVGPGDGDDRYQISRMADSDDCDFTPDQWSCREPRMRVMTACLSGGTDRQSRW
jgi:hypothetical protein